MRTKSAQLSKLLVGTLFLTLGACAGTPKSPNKFGHHHDYSYQTPAHVSAVDDDACGQRADSAAFASIKGMSDTPALLFGAIGAMAQIGRAKSKMNSTYEEVMQTCLRENGYDIPA